jgi:prevent-host-death family protein
MKMMPAGQFKAVCLRVMDEVNKTREPITITKKGKPVAKLMPADTPTKDVFGCMRGRLEILGDIVAPAVPTEDWESLV